MTMSTSPDWPHCGHGAHPDTDPVGCRGRRVEPYAECLAHLSDADRTAYLAGLEPGADVDHRGTRFSEALLHELLSTLRPTATNRPYLGRTLFTEAEFDGDAKFSGAVCSGDARFDYAQFGGDVSFVGAVFDGEVRFSWAKISGHANFFHVEIDGDARFGFMKISGNFAFVKAKISGEALFDATEFSGFTAFDGAEIGSDATFRGTVFQHASAVGPLVCKGALDLSAATFGTAVAIEVATLTLLCRRTRWASTAALRLRYAAVDLSDAVMEYPVSVAVRFRPFSMPFTQPLDPGVPELDREDSRVRMMSLRGADAAHLTLTDVDLTDCLFAGTIHLDQLRLEGRYPLAPTPSGVRWRGRWPVRWTPRRTLAEEQHWRAGRSTAAGGWTPAPEGVEVLEPVALAPVYRQLRKAFEDSKHEPGAADFYYGEMEMRRHADDIPSSERALLTAYWALSGYGLRASRALGWLAVAMMTTILLMMGFGLPNETPKQQVVKEKIDGKWTTVIDKPDPKNPTGNRFTGKRFEKALNVTLNSVVFRSSGQDLTTAGTYIEMTSRLTEPVLLGFAGLAVRGRVKRGS
ncbi:pentapeptide repeat-containing protein [Streptomyces sp. NPDC048483]|uniref:pentapeptide repeat-containing protein n=1 Tax=Streptomyces sp. NPDC048483 TaxID=3154927 RepID=UPI003424AC7D